MKDAYGVRGEGPQSFCDLHRHTFLPALENIHQLRSKVCTELKSLPPSSSLGRRGEGGGLKIAIFKSLGLSSDQPHLVDLGVPP